MIDLIDPAIARYAADMTAPEPGHLRALAEETRSATDLPVMLSGHVQGRFLSLISHLVRPRLVLDVGSFTGYSAMCLAEGLAPGGLVHTIDVDMRYAHIVDRHLRLSGLQDRVHQHIAPALEMIPRISGTFDLVFIDADKQNYVHYFDAVVERVRPGGMIIADNVLWDGKVLAPATAQDGETRGLAAYARKVQADPRVENMLLPLRDGLMLSRRK